MFVTDGPELKKCASQRNVKFILLRYVTTSNNLTNSQSIFIFKVAFWSGISGNLVFRD